MATKNNVNQNIPYVKEFDKNGNVKNPIQHDYMSLAPTRRQRRYERRRPHGDRPTGLIVYKNEKVRAFFQRIPIIETKKVPNPNDRRRKITVKTITGYKHIYHELPVDEFSIAKQQEN